MKRKKIIKSLQLAGFLITSLYACTSFADWSQKHPYGGYNNGYGDFPPVDIDQQLSGNLDEKDSAQNQPQAVQSTETKVTQQQPSALTNTTQNTTAQAPQPAVQQQAVQQPVYGGYYQHNQTPYAYRAQPYYNRNTGYSGPWNNSRYGFSGPWNNRGSGFSGPWNGGNNGTGFSGPWNNNGSSYSMPWGNNRSGFTPWGNGGRWGW